MRAQSSLSTEWVPYRAKATDFDGTPIDPSTVPTRMAFALLGVEPLEADWHGVSWFGNVAAVLVGPDTGGVQLAKSTYVVWIDVDDAQEHIVEPVGLLRIT